MWAHWIRSAPRSPVRTVRSVSKSRWQRLRLDRLEDRCVPATFQLGSTFVDRAWFVDFDAAGHAYVLGYFNGTVDFDPGPGTTTLTTSGSNTDPFIAKYSSTGSLLWVGQLTGVAVQASTVDASGAVYTTGYFRNTVDFDMGPGVFNLTSTPAYATFVAKYNPDGGFAWVRTFAGNNSDVMGATIALDAAGNIYSTGYLYGAAADFDPGPGTFTLTNSTGNSNTYVSKLDPAGNFLWAKQFVADSGSASVWAIDLAVDPAQNVYLAGHFRGRVDFDPSAATNWVQAVDLNADAFVAKLTAAGNLSYAVRMGTAINGQGERAFGIAVDPGGNAYVTGQFSGTATIDATAGDTTLVSTGNDDAYVMKLSPTGGLVWAGGFGSTAEDQAHAIAYDGTGNVYVTGFYSYTVDFDITAGVHELTHVGGGADIFVLKLNTDSTFVDVWGLGGTDIEQGQAIAATADGELGVVGWFQGTVDFDPGPGELNLTSAGFDDAFVMILGGNDPPVASDDTLTTSEDTPTTGTLVATDPEDDPLTFTLVDTANAHGTVTITNAATGDYSYTPYGDYYGPASFTFKATAAGADSNVATVSITVTSVNDPPDAVDDSLEVKEDGDATSVPVLANDTTSPDTGETLSVSAVSQPAHGTVAITGGGTGLTYQPAVGYAGPDSFTYTVSDGNGGQDTATVSVNVLFNNPPVAGDDEAMVVQNGGPQAIDVLTNDTTAPDTGETLTIVSVTHGRHGTVAITGGGTGLSYEPSAGYIGPDSFTYTVSDGAGKTDVGEVVVSVQESPNNPPTAAADHVTIGEDTGTHTIDVLANDSTAPDSGETLTITVATQGQHGTVAIAADGQSLYYAPAANFAGTDTFLYAVTDPRGGMAFASVTVTVTNDVADRLEVVTSPTVLQFTEGIAPVAVDDAVRVSPLNSGGIKKAFVRIASGYAKGRDFLIVPKTAGLFAAFNRLTGTLTLSGKALGLNPQAVLRTVQYKNASPMPVGGLRTITFTVADAFSIGEPAARQLQVIEINTPPVVTLTATALSFRENAPALAVAGTLRIKDLDNTVLAGATVAITTGFAAGQDALSVTLKPGITGSYDAGTGVLTLTGSAPRAAYQAVLRTVKYRNTSDGPSAGPRTLSFAVSDGTATSTPVTRVVNVIPVNDAPILDTTPNPTLPDVSKGNSNPAGTTVAALLGTAVADPDLGAQQGIAITALSGTGFGTWQFSTDGGANWLTIGTVSPLKALLLRSTDMLRFVPSGGLTGTAAISYRAWDQTTGTAGSTMAVGAGGGKSAFSLATEIASVNIV